MMKILYRNLQCVDIQENLTYKLSLRPIQDKDTENIVRWRNSEFVRHQFIYRKPFTSDSHREWLENKVYQGYVIQYIIELDGKAVGSVYLRDIDNQNENGEFGIFIGEKDVTGKGVGSKVSKAFTKYCFGLGFHRIFLRVLDDNIIAKKCYLKAGFKIEGIARDMVFIDGTRYDVTFMATINE